MHRDDVDNSLCQRIVTELTRRGLRLVTAESCTGGLLAKHITDQPGSSAVFETGLVTYANSAKVRLLGVSEDLLYAHGAVSKEVATAMAQGALDLHGGELALAITGIAGPGGGSEEKPVGLVWLALAARGHLRTEVMMPDGQEKYPGREVIRQKAVNKALGMLHAYLEAGSAV